MPNYFARKINEAVQVLRQDRNEPAKKGDAGDVLFSLLIIFLFATTLPHPAINVVSSFLTFASAMALAVHWRGSKGILLTRQKKQFLILAFICQLASCAQIALEAKPLDMTFFQALPTSYKVGGAWSIILCGIEVNPATIHDISRRERIFLPLYIVDWRSYGIVGLKKIIVVGV